MFEKWKVVVCTHIREQQPSSSGFSSLHLNHMGGEYFDFYHDMVLLFIFLLAHIFDRGEDHKNEVHGHTISTSASNINFILAI